MKYAGNPLDGADDPGCDRVGIRKSTLDLTRQGRINQDEADRSAPASAGFLRCMGKPRCERSGCPGLIDIDPETDTRSMTQRRVDRLHTARPEPYLVALDHHLDGEHDILAWLEVIARPLEHVREHRHLVQPGRIAEPDIGE